MEFLEKMEFRSQKWIIFGAGTVQGLILVVGGLFFALFWRQWGFHPEQCSCYLRINNGFMVLFVWARLKATMESFAGNVSVVAKMRKLHNETPLGTIEETKDPASVYIKLGIGVLTLYSVVAILVLIAGNAGSCLHVFTTVAVVWFTFAPFIVLFSQFVSSFQSRGSLTFYPSGVVWKDSKTGLVKDIFLLEIKNPHVPTMVLRHNYYCVPNQKNTAKFYLNGVYIGDYDNHCSTMERLRSSLVCTPLQKGRTIQ